jgi:hypothetical protein
MTTTPPDDVAAMFDLAPPSAAEEPAADAWAAEEAALAAELACAVESGDVADDAPDSRTILRVDVAWPGRMRLPGGAVIELKVRNISAGGVGLASDRHIPAATVVDFEMDVPPLDEGGSPTRVEGAIRTTYTVAHGSQILSGGTWQAPPAGLGLVNAWIERLRR